MTNEPQSLAFFIPFYKDGGAERVLFAVAEEALRRGHSVGIIALRDSAALRAALPLGAVLHVLKGLPLFAPMKLHKVIQKHYYSAVYSTLVLANSINTLTKIIFNPSHRCILREANSLPQHFAFRSPLSRFFAQCAVRRLYPRANVVICVSEEARMNLQGFLGEGMGNLKAIRNPVNLKRIKARAAEPCPHPWLLEKSLPVVLAAGRLKPQKGFDILLEAFASLKQQARLIILGEGTERASLQALAAKLGIESRIDLAGFVENPYPFYTAADVFVLSSLHEGMPNVLLDALACGTPIVATDCPSGTKELLQEGRYGTLVSAGDAQMLAAALENALNQPQERVSALDYLAQFDIKQITDLYLEAAHV